VKSSHAQGAFIREKNQAPDRTIAAKTQEPKQ